MQCFDEVQRELFDPVLWPKRPYCTDDFAAGLRIRSLAQALQYSYIQPNPPHLRVWLVFDVDRPAGAFAWEDAGLPPPSWTSTNQQNGHAHLVYGLSAPVLVSGLGARDAPMRYLCAIEAMMGARLQADMGYSGLITKNPQHPLWMLQRGPRLAYDLGELAEYLPGLEKYRPTRKAQEVGLGRNVALFDAVRKWAYTRVREFKGGGLAAWNQWLALTNTTALVRNADFANPLDGREVWHVAKSVATWTYRHFDVEASDKRFSGLQAHRGRKSGEARLAASEDKRSSARLMRSKGMTLQAVADELGVPLSTIGRWCS